MLVKEIIEKVFPHQVAQYVLAKLAEDDAYYTKARGSIDVSPFDTPNVTSRIYPVNPAIEVVEGSFGGDSIPRKLLREKKYNNDFDYIRDLTIAMQNDATYAPPQPIEITPINSFKQMLENL